MSEDEFRESPTFADLGLVEPLVRILSTLGYETPTPIQERAIPSLLEGKDVVGLAQTGTGKTAAFALPILQRIDPTNRKTQAIVLAPTRELALQRAMGASERVFELTRIYRGSSVTSFMRNGRLWAAAQPVIPLPIGICTFATSSAYPMDALTSSMLFSRFASRIVTRSPPRVTWRPLTAFSSASSRVVPDAAVVVM